jgi:hypothetical protein
VGKNFELTRLTRLSVLPKAGFTHVEFECSECGATCRVELEGLTVFQKMNSLAHAEPLMVCGRCGGPAVIGSIGAWSPTNFYRGPR